MALIYTLECSILHGFAGCVGYQMYILRLATGKEVMFRFTLSRHCLEQNRHLELYLKCYLLLGILRGGLKGHR